MTKNHMCYAVGCPLPGVFEYSLGTKGAVTCFIHQTIRNPSYWNRATAAIRENDDLVRVIRDISADTSSDSRWTYKVRDVCAHRVGLEPRDHERRYQWLARARAALSDAAIAAIGGDE